MSSYSNFSHAQLNVLYISVSMRINEIETGKKEMSKIEAIALGWKDKVRSPNSLERDLLIQLKAVKCKVHEAMCQQQAKQQQHATRVHKNK